MEFTLSTPDKDHHIYITGNEYLHQFLLKLCDIYKANVVYVSGDMRLTGKLVDLNKRISSIFPDMYDQRIIIKPQEHKINEIYRTDVILKLHRLCVHKLPLNIHYNCILNNRRIGHRSEFKHDSNTVENLILLKICNKFYLVNIYALLEVLKGQDDSRDFDATIDLFVKNRTIKYAIPKRAHVLDRVVRFIRNIEENKPNSLIPFLDFDDMESLGTKLSRWIIINLTEPPRQSEQIQKQPQLYTQSL